MKILLVTNIISPHQIPIAKQLALIVGDNNFRFATMAPPDPERKRLGWKTEASEPWIIRPGEKSSDMDQFDIWWNEADIVLSGERLFGKMSDRLKKDQLCFYMSERWWKPPLGTARLLWPNFLKLVLQFRKISKHSKFHYLSIGPFTARDVVLISNFKDRIWQWGYFTAPPSNTTNNLISSNKLHILWVGRMLPWKKVDILINAASDLKESKIPISLTLVGTGPCRKSLEKQAFKKLGTNIVKFLDPLPSHKIYELMQQHNVYVLPSTAYEGWGAVINESMSMGMAVVASDQAGAPAAIISHGDNGLLFQSENKNELTACLRNLSQDIKLREKIAKNATKTILNLWSPKIAAERLIEFSESILRNRDLPVYSTGPLKSARKWISDK